MIRGGKDDTRRKIYGEGRGYSKRRTTTGDRDDARGPGETDDATKRYQ